jgi:hypothetical protein
MSDTQVVTERDLIQRLADALQERCKYEGPFSEDGELCCEARAYLDQAPRAPQSEPYAWHYWNNGGDSVWHRGPSAKLDADMQAARDYPRVHHCIPVYATPPDAAAEIATLRQKIRGQALSLLSGSSREIERDAEIAKLRGALERLRQWNMLDNCDDGQWAKNLIDKVMK